MTAAPAPAPFAVRHDFRPGDLGTIVSLHGAIYASECGFGLSFEAYVAGPLARFAIERGERDRIWIAEWTTGGAVAGTVAIVSLGPREAQLRWFLVHPGARGAGLGRHLLDEAIAFARESGHDSLFLWTVSTLETASRLYRAAGFTKVEEKPGDFGVPVVEERYVLSLG